MSIPGPGCVLPYGVYLGEQERWEKHTQQDTRLLRTEEIPQTWQEAGGAAPTVLLQHQAHCKSLVKL